MKSRTILIGLNEINFDFLESYISNGHLPHFAKLLREYKIIKTHSEDEYHLLEPWIQWVTVYTGQTYAEHKVYRLGDITDHNTGPQIFETLEEQGLSVAAISPFNADNRLNKSPFFVPDPWTETKVSGNWLIKNFYKAIRQSVNDNAQSKVTITSLLTLALAFLLFVPVSKYGGYLQNVLNRKKPGMKAIVLDSLLIDVFVRLWRKNKPDFANIFLNSGAHIQHHYLFNSEAYTGPLNNPEWYCPKGWDPFLKVLETYDYLLSKIEKFKDVKLVIATGLHQEPHEHITYYWRLKSHEEFLKAIGISNYKKVLPRMSRDFLIEFDDAESCQEADQILSNYVSGIDQEKIFEVDNRGQSVFVELIYPNDIKDGHTIVSNNGHPAISNFKNFVAFVAIKNGEHNGVGYITSNFDIGIKDEIQLTELKDILIHESTT
jgi:hypothetical protein